MGKLDGKVAIITGGGSGMGRAMVNLFAKECARVVVGEWNDKTLAKVMDEVKAAGGQITGVKINIANQAEAEGLVDTAVKTYGRLDILCNNAGVMDHNAGVGEMTDEIWQRVLGINLNGTMYLTRRAVQVMVPQGGGSIINIASVAGLAGGVAGAAYTVSKHAIVGLTKNTAWMYAPKGIRCNAICPGAVATNIQASMDMSKVDPYGSGRLNLGYPTIPGTLQPMDIANLALFLASDDSRYINGAAIPADAGWQAI